jgi:predicted DNA-binding transcriptional regulator AlpA
MASTQSDVLRREAWLAVEGTRADVLLRQDAASALIGVSPRTMERWRNERSGPPFVRLSARAIRYSRAALCTWLATRTVENT